MTYFNKIEKIDFKNINLYIKMYNSNLRFNISKQKNKSNLSFSGKKIWKQKGTGNARVGSKKSPIWRGGARAFPNTGLENYKKKINKKYFKYCYKNCFFFFNSKKIFFFKLLKFRNISTKNFLFFFKNINFKKGKNLIVCFFKKNFYLSGKNTKYFYFLEPNYLNPYYIMSFDKILINFESFSFFYNYFNDL
ncbi:50S ribosomal protein L4 [Candidatus Vidania fulgoroideorum]